MFGHHQWGKRVNHHRQLLRLLLSNTSFIRTGRRSMWDACRMKGDMALLDIVPAHEVSIDVIQDFIRINIAMIVRRGYGSWMIVI